MDELSAELIAQLENALKYPASQQLLLKQQETLQAIINNCAVRRWLFEQARQTHQAVWAKKARLLIIRILQSSNQIWRGESGNMPEHYEEALARTWEWFSNNLSHYDPERATFVYWFNCYLKWRIRDVQREMTQAQQRREHPFVTESGELHDYLVNQS